MALNPKHLSVIQSLQGENPINLRERQYPLRKLYHIDAGAAWVDDQAHTEDSEVSPDHPIHTHVICGEGIPVDIPVCVHTAVGGESDFPNPGELLAAALASCFDMTIRMIANLQGIKLSHLKVNACFGADVRGALMTGEDVPVGFQTAQVTVDLSANDRLPKAQVKALLDAAERSCVVLQTLRSPPQVEIQGAFDHRTVSDAT